MKTLFEYLRDAGENNIAIGHFNIAELITLNAIFAAAQELQPGEKTPIIIGTSEGERTFIGVERCVALVRAIRETYNWPIFLNADHTKDVAFAKEAIDAGYDAVLFDGGKLPLEENIQKTKEIVEYARASRRKIFIEGELGYIGSSSKILDAIPEGAQIEEKDLTTPEEAKRFVEETGVDFLAPAVGNLHGMFKAAKNPHLNIERIKAIKEMAGVPLVLHGGSGTPDEDFAAAIQAGVDVVHISTELRSAWREGMNKAFAERPDEIAPYKLSDYAFEGVKKVVLERMRLFQRM
ncbi:MAG: tagatose-bisphosphate aldolase [Candidatus Harrisonbacteria bacterium CG10_big_fil_rev_8_21_14_0_10_42_17]|uniref:Tagatose-bisphosphate aldolase n=1 Tax=Candidatus Harrisonbacteria bacterium CG10_big_fil_rev_8_21_14_0_10_42_17 TaxID=1974584 RepID=A0A2M6WIM6_9BACT|nr:MAG: tagatose-bisphosphate aldolase [Candidatus Harrisonbacteria bacterium CG10_big_fil_rev_8_21_14_0_10_42_17]